MCCSYDLFRLQTFSGQTICLTRNSCTAVTPPSYSSHWASHPNNPNQVVSHPTPSVARFWTSFFTSSNFFHVFSCTRVAGGVVVVALSWGSKADLYQLPSSLNQVPELGLLLSPIRFYMALPSLSQLRVATSATYLVLSVLLSLLFLLLPFHLFPLPMVSTPSTIVFI